MFTKRNNKSFFYYSLKVIRYNKNYNESNYLGCHQKPKKYVYATFANKINHDMNTTLRESKRKGEYF